MDDTAAPPRRTLTGPATFLTSVLTSSSSPPTTSVLGRLDLRDDASNGPPVLITQTLTRPEGVVISVVTLGNSPPTSTITPTPTPTPTPDPPSSSHGLTNAEIAAIIGSVVGFLTLCLLLWCFCVVQRRRLEAWYAEHGSGSSSSYSESDSEVEMVRGGPRPGPVPARPRSVHFQTGGPANPRPPPPPVLNVTTTRYAPPSMSGPRREVGVGWRR